MEYLLRNFYARCHLPNAVFAESKRDFDYIFRSFNLPHNVAERIRHLVERVVQEERISPNRLHCLILDILADHLSAIYTDIRFYEESNSQIAALQIAALQNIEELSTSVENMIDILESYHEGPAFKMRRLQ